ncbi:SDR family NAD(P)-dependent oxidoreductase [Sandaracinobacteroides saxicola]|uniref:SDR family oxidoreductase n=1 Tax=Sandaracinobacteroides saxicola TaxID=2759707 RepID=A0A7G5IFY7_9SPHN|nr:SDR family oxidoreductase [Sandaracinobacteroides saxicola]QMW22279.1 SDR family oxidoreductase [Sandaracinobacteroides saxicola]
MDLKLKGLKTLVIGGTKGIGRATVRRFAAEGAHVAFCARGQDGVDKLAGELANSGVTVHGFVADAAGDAASFKAAVEAAAAALGGLDILVTCVSASGMMFDEAGFRKNFEVDVIGTYRAVEAAHPFLKASAHPSVVNIASIAAIEEFGGHQSFNSMKAATICYFNQLSHAWQADRIRFNTVSPGPIYEKEGVWGWVEANMPEVFAATPKAIPAGRYGTPEDVADAVAYLASPAASFVNATNLVIDGGYTKGVQY